MINIILLAIYCFGYVSLFRTYAWWLCEGNVIENFESILFVLFCAAVLTIIWPIIFFFSSLRKLVKHLGVERVEYLIMPRNERRKLKWQSKENQIREHQRRILELEKELGL